MKVSHPESYSKVSPQVNSIITEYKFDDVYSNHVTCNKHHLLITSDWMEHSDKEVCTLLLQSALIALLSTHSSDT